MSMKRRLLGGATLLMAAFSLNEANATSCAVPPTCAQLGYTMKKADCGDYPVMHCPFAVSDDNQVYCQKSVKQDVTLGAIVYGDGTVSTTIISGKTPVGIVFDAAHRLAVALTDVTKGGNAGSEGMNWSAKNYDIPTMASCTTDSDGASKVITCGVDGRSNTDKILACGSSCDGTPAASACSLYTTKGCTEAFCQKGKWFLPSMRDLNNIYQQKAVINATLSFLGQGSLLVDKSYWSSTQDKLGAWNLGMGNGSRENNYKDKYNMYVRPVVAF